ncbi:MAG: DNA polymerase domain-containing protein [Candidatus Aenigmatarchaeota archaeon]
MRMQMQILDCDYAMINSKPVIRLYGKTEDGSSVCAFYDKFRPYFYVHADEKNFPAITEELKRHGANAAVAEKFLPMGYSKSPVKVLKATCADPSKVPEMREAVKKYGTPYDADILFAYRFLVDHGLFGMGWADVKGKQVRTAAVKCRAIEAESIEPIDRPDNVPLRYMALDIECVTEGDRLPEAGRDPIIMISLYFSPEYKGKKTMVLLSKQAFVDSDCTGFNGEKEMIERFIDIVKEYDPDVLVGYNINNFDIPYLLGRMEALEIKPDLGRADKRPYTRKVTGSMITNITGRVIADPFEILKKDPWISFKRYNLATVAKEMLGMEKLDVGGVREIKKLWNGNTSDMKKLVDYCRRDSELAMRLVLDKGLLDKFFELSKISGLLLQDAFGGQTQRHECRLLHEFRKADMLMPCKPDQAEISRRLSERAKIGLTGAIVLEPAVGLHSSGCTLVLDFQSLYPSIIMAFNICPTTVLYDDSTSEYVTSPYGTKFVKKEVREGILPKMLRDMTDARKRAKAEMKKETNAERTRQLNAKQLALKTMANSLYGYTGYIRSRLYLMAIANSITSIGRENIINTKKLVEDNFPVKVIYGDTDSIFLKTDILNLDIAEQTGNEIASFITARLPGLSIAFEKIFNTFLILTKKRYAGWAFEKKDGKWKDKIVMKGIETVRRDWCELTSDTMKEVISIMLKEQNISKASQHVRKVLKDLAEGRVPLEKLTVVKGVTKSLDAYDGMQPHVELAKKIKERDPTRQNMVGERLGYVIIKGNDMLSKRAEEPEYAKEKGMEIDAQYYAENQVLPPVERIFEVCNITRTELLEGCRQRSLLDAMGSKEPSPDQTTLRGNDGVACKKCRWVSKRPPLTGMCPECGSQVYFSHNGSLGKFVSLN